MACSFHSERFSAHLKVLQLSMAMLIGMLAATQFSFAQEHFKGDALVQRLPDATAYIEVQTSWTSNVTTSSDSLTITVLAIKGDNIVAFAKDNVLARPTLEDSTILEHVHVRRLEVPEGSVRIEWSVNLADEPIWLHNMNVRVPIGGVPGLWSPPMSVSQARCLWQRPPQRVNQTWFTVGWISFHLSDAPFQPARWPHRFMLNSTELQTLSVTIHCS